MIKITNEDCMDLMARYPDKYFELAIVDPEYGNEKIFNGSADYANKHKQYKNIAPSNDYFFKLFRMSQNQIIWGGNYFSLPPSRGWVIWDKIRYVENYSRYELAYTSFDVHPKCFEYCNNAGFIAADLDKPKIHPSQKPVALYKWLLKNYAKPGDKILDTHLGSGSIAIACHDAGYDLTACEIDKDYYEAAMKRLEQHQKQLKLI